MLRLSLAMWPASSDFLRIGCYYPADVLPVRSRLLLEEMFDDGH